MVSPRTVSRQSSGSGLVPTPAPSLAQTAAELARLVEQVERYGESVLDQVMNRGTGSTDTLDMAAAKRKHEETLAILDKLTSALCEHKLQGVGAGWGDTGRQPVTAAQGDDKGQIEQMRNLALMVSAKLGAQKTLDM